MRIIGGKYRGKMFNPPANFKARPTTDFAKEALFNILNNDFNFENIDVLDLFSGTGSISYEFASRGVKSLVAVESNVKHAAYIEKNFKELGFSQAVIYKSDVFRYLDTCTKKFDVIFADPPYALDNIEEIVRQRTFQHFRPHEVGYYPKIPIISSLITKNTKKQE